MIWENRKQKGFIDHSWTWKEERLTNDLLEVEE